MRIQLNENLQYQDMKDQITPVLGIDQYQSSIGSDDDLITLDFTVAGKEQAEDLAEWFERGYDWVIDGETSPGEVKPGQFITFVEINRRIKSPERIMEMLDDLETLTDIRAEDWKIKIAGKEFPATVENIRRNLTVSPQEYRDSHPDDTGDEALSEWKQIAGVSMTTPQVSDTPDIVTLKRQAGLL